MFIDDNLHRLNMANIFKTRGGIMVKNKTKLTLKQRIFSGILAVLMIAGIFGTWPITIFAEEPAVEYVPVGSLGYKSNAEAIEAGEIIYLDVYALWGANSEYVDEFNNPCPQWVAYNDDTVYIGYWNGEPDPFSGKMIWENYNYYFDVGAEYEFCAAIRVEDVCDHNYIMFERMEATCTTDGYICYSCDKCDAVYEEKLLAPGHNYENGACTVCGYDPHYVSVESLGYQSNQAALDAGEVLYLNLWNLERELLGLGFTTKGLVDEYGYPLPNYLAYNDNRVFNTPDGWKNGNTDWMIRAEDVWMYIGPGGVYSHSCEPGAHYSHWIAIYRGNGCEHNYVKVERVEATCETQGYILYCCELCGETAKDVIPYPGHQWVVSESRAQNCTEDGYNRYTCTVCSEQYEEILRAFGHLTSPNGYCPNCGQKIGDFEADVWDGTIANGFGGGNGTSNDPYLIYTGAQLAYLASKTNSGNSYSGKYFKLMNNIDLNGINWTPIGRGNQTSNDDDNPSNVFMGIFDGNGYKIINLYINSTNLMKVGLFGSVVSAKIMSLGIEDASVTMTYGSAMSYGALLCGSAINSTVKNCYAIGNLSVTNTRATPSHNASAGMIIGYAARLSLSDCYANGRVEAISSVSGTYKSYSGGILGAASGNCSVYRAYFVGKVSAKAQSNMAYASGIIGCAFDGNPTIKNCFSVSELSAISNNQGYVSGMSTNLQGGHGGVSISGCYQVIISQKGTFVNSTGSASLENFQSQEWIATNLGWDFNNVWTFDNSNGYEYPVLQGFGAINGGNGNHTHQYSETERVDATCVTEGYIRYTCATCGNYYDEVLTSPPHKYISQTVEPTCQANGYTRYTCGYCGDYYDETIPAIEHQYVISETVDPTCKVEGYTRYTCSLCGDFYDETIAIIHHKVDANSYCTMCGKYIDKPISDIWDGSVANSFGGGNGTLDDPYLIYTGAELAYLAHLVNAGNSYGSQYFKLMCNIDLNNIEWAPIGKDCLTSNYVPERPFSGNFDGNGYTISNLFIASNNTSFAGLFGTTSGATIQNLIVTGADITNSVGSNVRSKAGVLIGLAVTTTVSNCGVTNSKVCAYATSDPSSSGGLIGIVSGNCKLNNCYVFADVIGNGHVGGIVGGNYGGSSTIKNSYSAGTVTFNGPTNNGVSKVVAGIIAYSQSTVSVQNCFTCVKIVIINSGSESSQISPDSISTSNAYHSISSGYNINTGIYTSEVNFQSKEWLIANLGWDFEKVWGFDNSNGYVYPILLGFDSVSGGNKCEHVYTETVVDPTCTTDGYTRYVCEKCGNEYNSDYVSQNGHTPGGWVIDYEPTCTTSGRKHSECTVCGQQLENIYISSLGHNLVTVVTREVTCTTPGVLTHTCERCGYNYSTYIYSEHAYAITEQVQPDCYTDGYTVYTCSKCQDQYTETIPGGHDYKSVITKVATSDEDGEITYTCEACGDFYTQVVPAREAASILLVQDRYPWSENNNVALLDQMLKDGYILGWDLTTTSNFENVDLGMYNVILIANDQSSATYQQLQYLSDTLLQFATAGGVLIYGACDSGWAGGNINYSLPEGVVKKNFYSRYNYIVDTEHLIVSGILTDGKALTNNLLYGNYCSHSAFDANTLPAGANVILQDAHGDATLVEYAVGEGHVILSGLTWEFYYNRNCYDGRTNTSYTKNVYDDLIVYAMNLSDPCDHIYDEGEVVAPTCTEDGYTLHVCQNCGVKMKDEIADKLGHVEGEWEVTREATQYDEGLKELRCTVCGEVLRSEVIPPVGGAAARVECDFDTIVIGGEVVFTFVIENCEPITSLNIVPVFDTDIFEIVYVEWLLEDAVHQEIEDGTYNSTSIWNEPINVNGAVYRIVLRVKQITNYPSIGFNLKIEDKENAVTVVPKVVEVTECKHTETRIEALDDTYHALVCTNCGHVVMEEHTFDDIYDIDCNECEYKRPLKGDVDNDGDVDEDDCIYLVYSVFFGTIEYPVYQNLDFDGDGTVCSEDGVYLLRYIYYGAGEYPLHE